MDVALWDDTGVASPGTTRAQEYCFRWRVEAFEDEGDALGLADPPGTEGVAGVGVVGRGRRWREGRR